MVLDTLFNKSSLRLYAYLNYRPEKQFTMLDCHDGVPVKPDLNDLYKSSEARKIVDKCIERGGNLSLIYSPKHKDPDGFDVHQIRGTYYSLLDCDDDAYLAARAIQFFTPGVPQVYYVGLLAGENDFQAFEKSSDGRAINRQNYSLEEIGTAVQKEVVQRLLRLIRFRNEYQAFNGGFSMPESKKDEIFILWQKDDKKCSLKINLKNYQSVIEYKDDQGKLAKYIV